MSIDINNFSFDANSSADQPSIHKYISSVDNVATISADGYFNNRSPGLLVKDLIYCYASNGPVLLSVTAISPTVTTENIQSKLMSNSVSGDITISESGVAALANDVVGEPNIKDGVITADKLSDSVITKNKLYYTYRNRWFHYIKTTDDASASATLSEETIGVTSAAATLTTVTFTPNSAITANDSNYATISIYKRNFDGTNQIKIAEVNTKTSGSGATGNISAFESFVISNISTSLGNGDVITWEINKVNSGVVIPSGILIFKYEFNV